MKTLFIKESRAVLLALFLSVVCIPVSAQDIATILFGEGNKTDYIGQYNYNGKRKNGFGIERQKSGAVYVGDFSEDKISGRGMLIANVKGIPNVSGAVVYVGNWRDGKKSGKGSCYSSDGSLVYEGRFENDKPASETISSSASSSQRFCMTEFDNNLYLGKTTGGTPDGFGLTVEDDGDIIYGIMRNGIRQGIGMIFHALDVWEVGKWTDGQFRSFNSSQVASSNLEAFRADNKAWKKEVRGMLTEAAFNFAQAGVTAATIAHDASQKDAPENIGGKVDEDNIASGKSLSYYQTLYNKWELKAKNTFEDRVRHKVTANTAGDGRVANSDAKLLRQYQKSMRSVRLAAQKEGFSIPQSKYEIASF